MDAVFFDLDNTLYSAEHNLFNLIDVRINRYMHEVVGIAPERVDGLRRHYWAVYGVTLQGLIQEYGADAEHYLDYVHDIDVPSRLSADPRLEQELGRIRARKFVFTNGSRDHAQRVLGCLGIERCFEAIYDIRVSNYIPKPQESPYRAVLKASGVSPQCSIMVEDSVPNLHTAARLGMKTILVGDDSAEAAHFDAVIRTASEAAQVVQRWQGDA
ncbi:pyrimidine 5'-nucleotidase [uncultured Desulfuromonas sp.]|uniref:pyrimidine 5'-nucleotidase n=1 Tax=uncultured Desulfuromonas sp. TaxID=181013 RepID=UPI002AAB5849|nr:pyrimidine 5'-nucleotidase [uncultured Desulfuromonas sp.]